MNKDGQNPSRAIHELALELRALVGQLRRVVREQAAVGGLTPSQEAVVLRLERDGDATVSALARAEGVRPQSMRTTVAALEKMGFVEGRADPADGRQTIISITGACRSWFGRMRDAKQNWLERQMAARLTSDEVERIAEATRLIRRMIED